MEKTIRRIQKRRKFTKEFKQSIVKDYESGQYSAVELGKLHKIACTSIYRWIYKYSTVNEKGYRIVEMEKSSTKKVKELEERIKELESAVGRKQIQIDFLEKMIDIAKEDLSIDIKKNYGTQRSNGSNQTKKR